MKNAVVLISVITVLAFAGVPIHEAITGILDASGATRTAPVRDGTTVPDSCTGSELFYDTDATGGQKLFGCDGGTFVLLSGGGGGGGGTYTPGTGLVLSGGEFSLDPATGLVFLRGSASLSFGSIAAQHCSEQTVTVTGAASGDTAIVGPPNNFIHELSVTGYVSAADTTKVKICNPTAGAITPTSSQTYNVIVPKAF